MNDERTVPVSIRLEPEELARLKVLAAADGRTLSNYIRMILRARITELAA